MDLITLGVHLERIEAKLNAVLDDQRTLVALLHSVIRKEGVIMALADDLKAGIKKLDDDTNAVAARIDALAAKVHNSMTDAEVADVKAALSAEADRLETLAVDPNNPVPPIPPPLQALRAK